MTRGRCGSLAHIRMTLAFTTPRRFSRRTRRKRMMDWETIQEFIKADDREKWDLRVQGKQLCFGSNGALAVRQNGGARACKLSDFAVTQLCQRLGIPARYFKRLPG